MCAASVATKTQEKPTEISEFYRTSFIVESEVDLTRKQWGRMFHYNNITAFFSIGADPGSMSTRPEMYFSSQFMQVTFESFATCMHSELHGTCMAYTLRNLYVL